MSITKSISVEERIVWLNIMVKTKAKYPLEVFIVSYQALWSFVSKLFKFQF